MQGKVQKWGNSLAVRIPQAFAKEVGLVQDSEVEISIANGHLIVAPVAPSPYTLEGLLAGVTDDNIHAEVLTGPPQGNEAW